MALTWLRSNQKRVLIPLTILIIITFVFLYGMESGPSGAGGEIVILVDGTRVTRQEYVEYQRALASLGIRDSRAPYRMLAEAAAARNMGLDVGNEELREFIRHWVRMRRPEGERITDEIYRDELSAWGLTPTLMERVMRDYALSAKLMQIGGDIAYITEHEAYLAYSSENLRLKIRYSDFEVDDHLDQVDEPTEDEVLAVFNEAAELDPSDPAAFATEPRVALEYVLFDGEKAAASAEKLRQTLASHGAEELAGPWGGLAGAMESGALAASREEAIRTHYERTKAFYRLPDDEGEEGEDLGEPRYQPLEEVRERIERELAQRAGPAAASSQARKFLSELNELASQDLTGSPAMTAGLGAAHYAAASMADQAARTAVFSTLGQELGGEHGVTALRTKEQLGTIESLGRAHSVAEEAMKRGASGDLRPAGPTWVQAGYTVWRVAGYEAPRLLSFEEARERVSERIRRQRAVELARRAADEFLERLETGELDLSALDRSRTLTADIPQAEPFVRLAVHELPVEPVAFDRDGRSIGFHAEDAGLFRVGVVTERNVPTMAEFKADDRWRQRSRKAMLMDIVRARYVSEAWRLSAIEEIEHRQLVSLE